jgi:hypothetical protein
MSRRVALFAGYCLLVSGVVLAWFAHDPASNVWRVVALGCIVALSIGLGRLLPGWGYAAPAVLAVGWLLVILATTPTPKVGDEGPTARALEFFFLVVTTIAAEAGVFVGSMGAVWAWTRARPSVQPDHAEREQQDRRDGQRDEE